MSVSEVCLFVCFDLDISVVAARRLDGSLKRVAKGGEARPDLAKREEGRR